MNDIVYLNVKRIMTILLITIQPFLIASILNVLFPTLLVFRYITIIFLIIVINELIVLGLSVLTSLKIKGKEYFNSTFYEEFNKEYRELTNSEKALYYYSRIIEKRLHIAPIFNKLYDDHFYFVIDDKNCYSVMVKDYFGIVQSDIQSRIWNIKYKDRIKEINNPFHLNKKVMDKFVLNIYESIENIVLISERTKLETKIDGIYHLGDFLYKMK